MDSSHVSKTIYGLIQSGRYSDAIPLLGRIIQANSRNATARYVLSFALANMGDRREALSQVQESLRIDPDSKPARDLLDALQK